MAGHFPPPGRFYPGLGQRRQGQAFGALTCGLDPAERPEMPGPNGGCRAAKVAPFLTATGRLERRHKGFALVADPIRQALEARRPRVRGLDLGARRGAPDVGSSISIYCHQKVTVRGKTDRAEKHLRAFERQFDIQMGTMPAAGDMGRGGIRCKPRMLRERPTCNWGPRPCR